MAKYGQLILEVTDKTMVETTLPLGGSEAMEVEIVHNRTKIRGNTKEP